MDKATGPGIALALGALLLSVILEGGSPAALVNLPAAVLVFGGTIGASMAAASFATVVALPRFVRLAFVSKVPEGREIVNTFVRLADRARREGLLALEEEAERLDPFAKKGVLLIVDGTDPGLVREVLEAEIVAMQQRHRTCYGLLEAMGGFAPTMGIIGTVMGLVNVLSKLEDPSELGHSIATAFIATLYGVASANVLWLPLASKLRHKSAEEVAVRELIVEGVLSVQAGDNPRIVRQKLEAKLAPAQRAPAGPPAGARATDPAPAPAGG
jgi:chemotaxis protein MotA